MEIWTSNANNWQHLDFAIQTRTSALGGPVGPAMPSRQAERGGVRAGKFAFPPLSPPCGFCRVPHSTRGAHLEAEFEHVWKTLMKTTAVMYDEHMPFLWNGQKSSNNEITSRYMPCAFWKQKMDMYWKSYWKNKLFDVWPTAGVLWVGDFDLGNRIFA